MQRNEKWSSSLSSDTVRASDDNIPCVADLWASISDQRRFGNRDIRLQWMTHFFYLVEHELWWPKPVSHENIVQSFCFGCELLTFCINTVPNLWIGFGFTPLMFQFIGFTFNSAEIHKTNLFFSSFFRSVQPLHNMQWLI